MAKCITSRLSPCRPAPSRAIGLPRTRIERLAQEQVDLTPDTAIRLARFFGTSAEFWMAIQSCYALERATDLLGEDLLQIEPMRQAS